MKGSNAMSTHDNTTASARMMTWLTRLLDHLPADVTVFPRAAGQPIVPLAIGTAKHLEELGVPSEAVAEVIRGYSRHPAYLRALARPGAMRHDLTGQPVEPVSAEHARYAAASLENRRRRRDEEANRRVAAVRDAALSAKSTTAEPVTVVAVAEPEPEQAPRTKPTLKLGTRPSPAEIECRPQAARSGVRERTIRTSG